MPDRFQYNTDLPAADSLRRLDIVQYDNKIEVQTDPHDMTFVVSIPREEYNGFHYNGFQRRLYGRMADTAEGSIVSGHFKSSPFTQLGMSLWFGVVGLVELIQLVSVVDQIITGRSQLEVHPVLAVVAPLLFGLIGYGFVRFAQWIGRENEARMVAYLRDIIPPAQANSKNVPDGGDTTL